MNSRNNSNRGRFGAMLTVEKPKNAKKTLKRLFTYIGSEAYLFFFLMFFACLVSLLALANPYLQGLAMDLITINEKNISVNWEMLLLVIYGMILTSIGTSIFSYFQALFAARLSQTTVTKMRNDLFQTIVALPVSFIDNHKHGDITSRMTNDIDKISNTISSSIASLVSGLLTVVGILGIMIYFNWFLAIISTVSVGITIITVKNLSKVMRKHFKKQQALLGELNGHSEEVITGYKTVAAYSQEQQMKDKFNDVSTKLKGVAIKAQLWSGLMGPVMNLINNFSFLLVCFFGGYLAATKSSLGSWTSGGIVSVGMLATFILYSKRLSRPINELANLWAQIASSMAAAERVFDILDTKHEIDEGTETIENVFGEIKFNNVNFGYTDTLVLKDFNLDIKPGQKIAIVGATGSGKTTIVNLLMRFYEINSGTITIDGVDITSIPKSELRKLIAIVLQDTILFQTTIDDNIKYGKLDATEDEMIEASKLSFANHFIEKLKDGYNTELSEGASNISQGEQQLLSITRAILADPKILILDEATSSVDTRTEKHIQDAMVKLMKNRTSLIIAHRLSTIQDADVIIVIDKGSVVEKGNHLELLNQKGKYYNLYQTQFAGIAT